MASKEVNAATAAQLKLEKLFNLHIFTPPSQSSIVRQDLDNLFPANTDIHLNLDEESRVTKTSSDNDLGSFKTVDYFKYISRKHGLPSYLVSFLQSKLNSTSDSISLKTKFQISQTLKYCIEKDGDSLTFNQLLDSLTTTSSLVPQFDLNDAGNSGLALANLDDLQLVQGILSQLVECIAIKINRDNFDASVISRLEPFVPHVNPKTRAKVLNCLEKWDVSLTSAKLVQNKGGFGDRIEKDFLVEGSTGEKSLRISESGGRVLERVGENRQNRVGGGIKADAVKTQQVVMSCYKENMSEKTEIKNISLANALNSNRSKACQRNSESSVSPGSRGGQGSDRSWWSTTGGDITTIFNRASARQTIKEKDVEWLKDKTCFGFRITNAAVTMYELERICQIFFTVIEFQVISDEIMVQLTHNFFSENLDQRYEECRLKLLKTFEIYSRRNDGRIPSTMEKNLTRFKNQFSCCTKDMKTLIFKIFAKNDKKLHETFPMALEHLKSLANKIWDPEVDLEQIEFLATQIVVEQRAKELEMKFRFLEQFLKVVENDRYNSKVRIQVLEMVEDYLVFDKRGLNSKWLEVFLKMYRSAMASSEQDLKIVMKYQFNDFQPDDLKRFTTSLMRSVLNTFNKPESPDPTEAVLALLVETATQNRDRKLEALIIVTLGNLVNHPNPIQIPNAQLLSSKLLVEDTIDDDAIVHLADLNEEENDFHADDPIDLNRTYISCIVANILVKSLRYQNKDFTNSAVQHFLEAVQKCRDKMTRILCSEYLFEVSKTKHFSQVQVGTLRPLTLDPVFDIQVYITAAYCLSLQKMCCTSDISKKFKILPQDLNWLPKIYEFDQTLVLGEKNFVHYINPPILKILDEVASSVKFSDEIFQLLTFVLNDEVLERKICLEIISQHLEFKYPDGSKFLFPHYCLEAIENIFQSVTSLFEISASVLIKASHKLGYIFSDTVVEFAHRTLMSQSDFNKEMGTSLSLIFQAQNSQDLPEFIFHDLDMQIICTRLVSLIQIPAPNVNASKAIRIIWSASLANDHVEMQHQTLSCVKGALEIFQNYLSYGRKFSILPFHVIESLLQLKMDIDGVIQCLIYAAENGQSLSKRLMETAFENFEKSSINEANSLKEENSNVQNLKILTLAFGLVQNNQSLPESFMNQLVALFCKETARGCTIGEDDEYDQILFVLAKLAQQSLAPLPKSRNLAIHFCNLWKNSNSSRQRMGVLTTWMGNNTLLSPEEKAIEVVKRFCRFWKKSRSHRHRLEILGALKGLISASRDELNLQEVHKIFVEAAESKNFQIQETAVQALIALNWDGAIYCDQKDFKRLFSILSDQDGSPSMKKRVADFLNKNLEKLADHIRKEFSLLQNLEQLNDEEFLNQVESLGDCTETEEEDESDSSSKNLNRSMIELTVFQNPHFISRFESILLRKANQPLQIVEQSLKIIGEFLIENSPASIFEAVALCMVTNSKSTSIQENSQKILNGLAGSPEKASLVTPTLIEYLKMTNENGSLLLKFFNMGHFQENEFWRNLKLKVGVEDFIHQMEIDGISEDEKNKLCQKFEAEILNSTSFNVFQLDNSTIRKLMEFHDEGFLISSGNFLKMVAIYVITTKSIMHQDDWKTCSAIIEESILSEASILHPVVFKAYEFVIEQKVDKDLGKCVGALTILFDQIVSRSDDHADEEDRRKMSNILCCIHKAVQYATGDEGSYIPIETVQLLADQLVQDRHLAIRQQSFRALRNLKAESIRIVTESNRDDTKQFFLPDISKIALHVFTQVFDDQKKAIEQIKINGEFVSELLDLLFSLRFWDLQSLRRIQDESWKWRKTLLISNFVSCFATSENEKLEMVLALRDLYRCHNRPYDQEGEGEMPSTDEGDGSESDEQYREFEASPEESDAEDSEASKSDDENVTKDKGRISSGEEDEDLKSKRKQNRPEIILTLLTRELTEEISRSGTVPTQFVLTTLRTLSKLPFIQVLKILMNPLVEFEKGRAQILFQIEESSVASTMSQKMKFKLKSGLLRSLARKIVESVGPDLAQGLVKSLGKIQDLSNIEDLIHNLILVKESSKNGRYLEFLLEHFDRDINRKWKIQDVVILIKSQILLNDLPEGFRRTGRVESMFNSLLNNGIRLDQLQTFLKLSIERTGNEPRKIFEHICFQSCQYNISATIFDQIVSALKNSDLRWNVSDCIDTCNRIINDFAFDATLGGVKSISQIISEYCASNSDLVDQDDNNQEFSNEIVKIQQCRKKSHILHEKQVEICDWSVGDIKKWARAVRSGHLLSEKEFLMEALMVAKQAFFLQTNFHMTHVQVLACLFGLVESKGKLLQVATGSGKSAIIGIIAVIRCLQTGKTVDIYTSSSVLAERDAKEWSKFYSMFDITCDHNADKSNCYISGLKSCYEKQIVYGDSSQYQFDYLRHSYSDLGTIGDREFCYAIIDEVDSMFIDDSSKLARLSSTLPGMDLLHVLYHLMWDRMSFIKSHLFQLFDKIYYLEGQTIAGSAVDADGGSWNLAYTFADQETSELKTIDNVVEYIVGGGNLQEARIHPVENVESCVEDHLKKYTLALISDKKVEGFSNGQNRAVKLPKNLQKFAETQIPKWVDSCLAAIAFQENVHYIVDDGQVKPVDFKTTGVVQGSTNWNNGLHQFLQIKHGLKLGSESVTTNFLSNMAMFQKYGSNLVGFTGTLGSDASRKVFRQVYDVDLLIIPETHYKRYVRFPDFVATSDEEWLKEILITTLEEVAKRRGVLIIFETIKQADFVSEALKKFRQVKVKIYTKNMENQEKQIERIHPGDVIVATNLAGRGTDIKTADIEKYGGLHVCLTFLPSSLRVEEQAFGRTSRQGKRGTGQLIIQAPSCEVNQKLFTGSAEQLSQERDEEEQKGLENFQSRELSVIQMKDKLFAYFSKLFSDIRSTLREKRSIVKKVTDIAVEAVLRRTAPTPFEVIHLQAVEERWAMFLRQVDDGQIPAKRAEEMYGDFERELLDDQDNAQLIWNSENLFYLIQLGNYEYNRDSKFIRTLDAAKKYFEDAIKLDSNFAAGAHTGKAYVLLKGRENLIWFNNHENGYKEEGLKSLNLARPLLHNEMALLTVMQTLVQKQNGGNMQTPIFNQLTEKSNLLGSYLKNVEVTISTIEKSLRRVCCTGLSMKDVPAFSGVKMEREESQIIPDSVIQSKKEIPWTHFQKYHLTFHDLTVREDSSFVLDQAVNTISLEDWRATAKKMKAKMTNAAKNLFRSEKVNKTELNKFPIKLTCHQLDLGSFVGQEGILKQKFDLDVSLTGVELLEDDNLNFDPTKLDVKFSSFTFTIEVAVNNNQNKDVPLKPPTINVVKNLQMELHTFSKNGASDGEVLKLGVDQNEAKVKLFTDLRKIVEQDEGQVGLKFLNITNLPRIKQLIQLVKSSSGLSINNLNLTLNSVEKNLENLKNTWNNYLKNEFPEIIIQFQNVDEKSAKFLIPPLRKLNTEFGTWFTLQCRDLSLDTAQFILGKADIDQEDIEQQSLKELIALFMSDHLPLVELRDLSARGISLIVTFNERQFVPWISVVAVVSLAAVQAAAGAALICTGFGATVGMGLITEGMADLVTAQRIYSTRQFSWSDYRTQKAVSLVISAVSMGLSSLKDGAKGVSILAQGASEAAEQAGARVIVNGRTLSTAISVAGKNLKSLAIKHVAVSIAETGTRIVLKSLGDSLACFCFDQVKEGISRDVSQRVQNGFNRPELQKILSFYYAFDSQKLSWNVQSIVDSTTNPKANEWLQLWSSVGSPLCSGILSSPQFLGSTFSRITLIYGMISGMTEITLVVNRVCDEILTRLTEQKPDLPTILQMYAGLSLETSLKISKQISFKPGSDFKIVDFPRVSAFVTAQQHNNVKGVLEKLENKQKGFGIDSFEVSKMMRGVVDSITSHIIKVANSHLVSPVMSMNVGKLVAKISEELQDRFLVHESQNTNEQNDLRKKVNELNKKPEKERTEDERTFLEQNNRKNTFANQINFNSKDLMIAWQKGEIVVKSMKKNEEKSEKSEGHSKSNRKKEESEEILAKADQVLDKGPVDMSLLFMMATKNNINLKITDDPDYELTPEEKSQGVQVLIFDKPRDGQQVGHYRVKTSDGNVLDFVNKEGSMNCGWDCMSYLTGKSCDQLRLDMANHLLNNPDQYREIKGTSDWLRNRWPQQVGELLMVGGVRHKHYNQEAITNEQRDEAERLLEGKKAEDRLFKGPTDQDEPGFIYIYRKKSDSANCDSTVNTYKIGYAEDVDDRVGQSEKNNKEEYDVVAVISTSSKKATENVVHKMLARYRMPQLVGIDGGTEYFRGELGLFIASAQLASDQMYTIHGGTRPVRFETNPFEFIIDQHGNAMVDWDKLTTWGNDNFRGGRNF